MRYFERIIPKNYSYLFLPYPFGTQCPSFHGLQHNIKHIHQFICYVHLYHKIIFVVNSHLDHRVAGCRSNATLVTLVPGHHDVALLTPSKTPAKITAALLFTCCRCAICYCITINMHSFMFIFICDCIVYLYLIEHSNA